MSDVEMLDFEAFKERYEKLPVEEYPNNVREAVPDPVVSIHLLTYNHVDYIGDAIESVLMQKVDFPMEIVLGDDDSSDGTREICIEYAEQYPDLIRLQLHHRENNIHLHGGATHLFQYWYNTFAARGNYTAVLSGDDYWTDEDKLLKQATFLEKNDDYVLSHHDGVVVNDNGLTIKDSQLPEGKKRDLSCEELMKAPFLITNSLFFRSTPPEIPRPALQSLNEDLFLVGYLGQYGKGRYQEEISPSAYREHGESAWSSLEWKEKKERLLTTTRNLAKYYSSSDYKEICIYHQKMLIKGLYLYNLRTKNYKDALEKWVKAVNIIYQQESFYELFTFLRHSITMFLGSLKIRR